MSSCQPFPDFSETKLGRKDMLNLVSDKNKENKHGSMVCSIAEEKQSSQSKKVLCYKRGNHGKQRASQVRQSNTDSR